MRVLVDFAAHVTKWDCRPLDQAALNRSVSVASMTARHNTVDTRRRREYQFARGPLGHQNRHYAEFCEWIVGESPEALMSFNS
jgi:hypothetical protein